mmetsp:Transcript_9157/g.21991  ORF Transcript_9157/g.21991 Transcript_9157/m.21991 type:complete len:113 (-) Transcript_9157:170-508(-)|eukprot:4923706-Prymnesium_polylepis.1
MCSHTLKEGSTTSPTRSTRCIAKSPQRCSSPSDDHRSSCGFQPLRSQLAITEVPATYQAYTRPRLEPQPIVYYAVTAPTSKPTPMLTRTPELMQMPMLTRMTTHEGHFSREP